jgi:PEP-CTERM motif
LNGINFGIISLDTFNPTSALASEPLIKNSVVFVLTIPGPALTTADISTVAFQYGTEFGDPVFSGTQQVIPEPSTLLLLSSGLAALVVTGWRKRQAHKAV